MFFSLATKRRSSAFTKKKKIRRSPTSLSAKQLKLNHGDRRMRWIEVGRGCRRTGTSKPPDNNSHPLLLPATSFFLAGTPPASPCTACNSCTCSRTQAASTPAPSLLRSRARPALSRRIRE